MTLEEIKEIIDNLDMDLIYDFMTTSYVDTSKEITSYKINKDREIQVYREILLPPEVERSYYLVNISPKIKEEYRLPMVTFSKTLLHLFPEKDLIIFFNNINKLKIKNKGLLLEFIINVLFNCNYDAVYSEIKNQIIIGNNIYDSIYHELFHMASSIFQGEISYSGFKQANITGNRYIIGRGLNEGYTELLAERYFVVHEEDTMPYEYEVHLAKHLEMIVGKDKMERWYLTANLFALVEELQQYFNYNDVIQFLKSIDFISMFAYKLSTDGFKKAFNEDLKFVNEFLFKSYAQKLRKELINQKITVNDMYQMLLDYIISLGHSASFNDEYFSYFSDNYLDEIKRMLREIELSKENNGSKSKII